MSLAVAATAVAQSFRVADHVPGYTETSTVGVTFDGETVVGNAARFIGTHWDPLPVVWRWRSGQDPMGMTGALPGDQAACVSGSGSTVAGLSQGGVALLVIAGSRESIADLPLWSALRQLSSDGSVLVGRGPDAFRWSRSTGRVDLGFLYPSFPSSGAAGVSADGERIVGRSWAPSPGMFPWDEAFEWRLPSGPMHGLGFAGLPDSGANGVSADGSVAVGYVRSPQFPGDGSGLVVAARFDEDGAQPLMTSIWSESTCTSADGERVVGWYQPDSTRRVFVWDRLRGALDLQDVLARRGIDIGDWTLTSVRGISGDGTIIVGDVGEYETRMFVVELPLLCDSDLNADGVIDFADYLEFLNLYDALDLRADLSGDGVVDFGDYLEFLNHFDAGC